jgi:hypothetical protein
VRDRGGVSATTELDHAQCRQAPATTFVVGHHIQTSDAAAIGWTNSTWDALRPFATDEVYVNFRWLGDKADRRAARRGVRIEPRPPRSHPRGLMMTIDGLFDAAAHHR